MMLCDDCLHSAICENTTQGNCDWYLSEKELKEKWTPNEVSEVICLKCLHRWVAVYPSQTLLKELECKCGEIGFVIKTGQTIPEDR